MALVKPEVRWRAVSAADLRTITFSARQLQRKFKHAVDFGVMGKYSRQQVTRFERAIGLNVMRETQGAFVAGWRLTLVQLANVLVRRSL